MLKTVGFPSTRTGDQTIVDGSLIIGTSGEGVDFSADGHATGMTSELLDDYEEGNWTPTNSLAITVNFARYTKVGNKVTCWFSITAGGSGTGGDMGGLPFAPSATLSPGVVGYQTENTTETWGIATTGGTSWSFRLGSAQKQLSAGKQAVGVIEYYV